MAGEPEKGPIARTEQVCAVVVSYRVGGALRPVIAALRPQVDHIVIVDSGSMDDTLIVLQQLQAADPSGIECLLNGDNNLAKSQNMGISLARLRGYGWILLMDHDSIPAPGMVQALREAYRYSKEPSKVGLVAPWLEDAQSSKQPRYVHSFWWAFFRRLKFTDSVRVREAQSVIASGSLIPSKVFETIGGMDEGFRIDYLDKDFCLRLGLAGYRILVARDAVLTHRLGDSEDKHFLGVRITATNHSPERRYTIWRNRVVTWKRYGLHAPSYVLFDIIAGKVEAIRVLLAEKDRWRKLCAMLRGFWDGLRA